jgi:hypothetical protein
MLGSLSHLVYMLHISQSNMMWYDMIWLHFLAISPSRQKSYLLYADFCTYSIFSQTYWWLFNNRKYSVSLFGIFSLGKDRQVFLKKVSLPKPLSAICRFWSTCSIKYGTVCISHGNVKCLPVGQSLWTLKF